MAPAKGFRCVCDLGGDRPGMGSGSAACLLVGGCVSLPRSGSGRGRRVRVRCGLWLAVLVVTTVDMSSFYGLLVYLVSAIRDVLRR